MVDVKKIGSDVAALVVKAIATYGLLLLVIIAVLILISVAGSALDIIKDALNYAVYVIP